MSNLCEICRKFSENLRNAREIDKDNVDIISNLRKCVPEVEWNIDFAICPPCLQQLQNVCAFREMCIKSYEARKEAKAFEEFKEKPVEEPDCTLDTEKQTTSQFVCFDCGRGYKMKRALVAHMKKHEQDVKKQGELKESYRCDYCKKAWKTEAMLERHLQKCTDVKVLVCDTCRACFGNKYLLKRHKRNVHATEKKFKCELCDRKFASPVYLNAHKRYHSGERKHICSFCGKGYITASDLYHHEKIHANKRAYRCEICPKAFNTSSDLHKHKICVHLDRSKWKYECSYCQRRFPLKTNLDTHTKTHTGEKNFVCHMCERKCINKSVLKRHIASHSVEKSFKCDLCLTPYKYKKSLDMHLAKVHGVGDVAIPEKVKKFACTLCTKAYYANNKLQKHMRSHTGERPFTCPSCDKSFIDKSYIKQHMKTAHGVVNYEG